MDGRCKLAPGLGPDASVWKVLRLAPLAFATGATALVAQVSPPPAPGTPSVVVAPGAGYAAGGLFSALLGGGYRALWTTSIEVPVADLSRIGGGLVPQRVGGGMTTQTLHLDGADGRRYVFRSVHKTPRELLEEFAGSALEGIIQDQMSSFHPTGAPVVARLLDGVGVLHPEPVYMVVPDDPRLGTFREQFAGLLVLVEERPDDGEGGGPGFGASRRIVQTDDLFRTLEEDPANRLDAEELLRARLVDLLVGDRDRSHNNHLWARYDREGGGYLWRVIPRDRDQAFVRFDGLFKALARHYDRRLITFGDAYPDIHGLTRNAWDLDRNLLVGLDRSAWDRVTGEVVARLTDDVISDAVGRMPREHVAVLGAEMREALLRRRDHLAEASEALYGIVFGVADVHGTDVAEEAHIQREADGSVSVTLFAEGASEPSYGRTFDPDETSEVRIYLQGGRDTAFLQGDGTPDILLRVMGGGGRDRFVSRGALTRTVLYDADDDTEFPEQSGATLRKVSTPRPFSWFDDVRTLDWGHRALPEPSLGYDAERGLVLAAGLQDERYGFLKQPYRDRVHIQAGWAFGLDKPLFDYTHMMRSVVGGRDLRLHARWSGMELLNFFGSGNDTGDGPLAYHRIAHTQVGATVSVSAGDGGRHYIAVGPTFTYTGTDTSGVHTLLADTNPYGGGDFAQVGLRLSFTVDDRHGSATPTSGYRLTGGASAFPALLDVAKGAFGEAHGQFATYLSPSRGNPVLAVRVSAKKVWGTYPFAEAAFLGGPRTLRGLREQRYAGDASLLGSAEVRIEVCRIIFPIMADIGLFALSDVGRVWVSGDPSTTWHSGAGGGVWMALLNRSNLLRIAVVSSEGRTSVDAGVGFAFQ